MYLWSMTNKHAIFNREQLENKRWDFLFCPCCCHDGWDTNVLRDGCRHRWYSPWLKYWIPIHYDTIEDEQNKKISSFILILIVSIVLFLHFIGRIYLSKILLHHSTVVIWIITPLLKINGLIQTKINAWHSSCRINYMYVQRWHARLGAHVQIYAS